MINPKTNQRELSYVVIIDNIEEIIGSDNCEAAIIGGWKVMVRKNTFKPKDVAIYFEIDSKVPEKEPFEFLANKHYKIKTQKYTFGGKNPGFWSQGLLMAASDFGWTIDSAQFAGSLDFIIDDEGIQHIPGDESMFLTKKLGITYYEAEDNRRKAASDPYVPVRAALNRHPKIAKKYGRFIKNHKFAQKIFMLLFGKKKDKKKSWPDWVKKTDEERVQNMPWILDDKSEWFATEKIDGTSSTYTMRGRGRKREFYICSRNVCFDTPEKMSTGAYYNTNVYQEMGIKYDIENVLSSLMEVDETLEFVTIQGETYGASIQKREYGLKGHDFMAFNLIFGYKDGRKERLNPKEMTDILTGYGVPCVPIINEHFILPDTVEELLNIATGNSAIDGKPREGIVFRSPDGERSFKAVSNEFLMKFHN